ncbi:DUF916 domain-containing protein [Microbacterium sp. NPDC096154]|uniref:WxL protein peptidoglycan domain-containing protein n=1 Tax=Microbacterium sp. NPDC096154 TaxID=3155549 RepID=UPI00332A0E26
MTAAILSSALLPSAAGAATHVATGLAPAAAGAIEEVAEPEGPEAWAVAPANAEGPDGRSSFDYVVEAGDTYEDHVAVRNFGEEPITVELYAQDAVQTVENAFEVLTPDERGRRVGAWLTLHSTEVTVPPRENVVVPFAIAVPADAEPGDHAGGIVAVSEAVEGSGASMQYRVGARIHLRVAGPVEAGLEVDSLAGRHDTRLSPFAAAPLHVDATLENTGNVRLSPDALVRVDGIFGWWSATAPVEGIEEILPEGAQAASVTVDEVPPIGPLWVTVEVAGVQSTGQDVTELAEITTRTIVVWAVPWVLVVAVALLLAAVVLAIVNLRRRRRVARTEQAEPGESSEPGD